MNPELMIIRFEINLKSGFKHKLKSECGIIDEYQKVRPQSQTGDLGGSIQFSIPQFGDFFHDMVCRVRLAAVYGNAGLTPLQALGTAANPALFPLNGTLANGVAAARNFYNIVDVNGQIIVAGVAAAPTAQVNYTNYVRYCEYPGNRLFSKVSFDVNGNPLDTYDEHIPVMLEKFCTPPHKRTGHDRLVGQEVPVTGYGQLNQSQVFDHDSTNTPAGITAFDAFQSNHTVHLFNLNSNTLAGSAATTGTTLLAQPNGATTSPNYSVALNVQPLAQYDVSRQLLQFVNGPQTPKPHQPPLEIWNKLRFWFNDDVRLSIASVSIPFGQRFITIELNRASALVYEYPSIYLETIVDTGASRTKSYAPIFQPFGTSALKIEKTELYINNIFVNPEINQKCNVFAHRANIVFAHRANTVMGLKKYTQKRMLVITWLLFSLLL